MPKRETGVYTIKRSRMFQWRIKTPDDLAHLYPSEWAHRTSLKTADLAEANTKAALLRAEWLIRFEHDRQSLTQHAVSSITPELISLLCDHLRQQYLQADQERRTDRIGYPVRAASFEARGLMPVQPQDGPITPIAPLAPIPVDYRKAVAGFNLMLETVARARLASDDLQSALGTTQRLAQPLGITFNENNPGIADLLRAGLEAQATALTEMRQRDQGIPIQTPVAASLESAKQVTTPTLAIQIQPTAVSMTMREVFAKWKTFEVRGTNAVNACERALRLFEE